MKPREKIKLTKKTRIIFNFFRSKILTKFFQNYVKKSLSKRKGKCKKCGVCCDPKCVHLINNRCKKWDNRPCMWHDFPIDKFDKYTLNKECGFYWKDESNNDISTT